MIITMKIKQGLTAIALMVAATSAWATPSTSYYIYDESGHVIGEYDANGNPVQEHIYLGDRPVAVVQNGNAATLDYVTTDQLNTPRAVTDSSQTVEWSWSSDPFGNGQPSGSLTYNLRFPGQYYDAETGHNYNVERDYDPATGRYIESDPIGLDGGIDTYLYTHGNPVRFVDPFGLWPFPFHAGQAKANAQISANLQNAGFSQSQADKIAGDITDAAGLSDLSAARAMQQAAEGGKCLTPAQINTVKAFIARLPIEDQPPLLNLLTSQLTACHCPTK